ncbi:S-adenosyl-L-methionine methyltransferase [Sulfitobacter sp. THAF37]|uniref:class I SAM-dependent methyltransferase n=1 Tax=Sulfitobacter sp. THAF37 TaxID=2587855 RepID=UPI0012678A40|nr:class I SAM-dependent methyltransferase [Sulfitobacter sp. THAF37]QFT58794.1 S-adenosyl-L-methionine methyltransferase [Sulfitobacter sp. THAF37]
MSRLESMRRRLTAQIEGLNWAAAQIANLQGDVLELGLGNGRTYDHLRAGLPDRRIWVIDREMNAHPSCVPPEADFLQGDADRMLDRMARAGTRLSLVHYELGIGVPEADAVKSRGLSPLIAPLLVPGGLVISQDPLEGFERIAGPETVADGRYLFYRA